MTPLFLSLRISNLPVDSVGSTFKTYQNTRCSPPLLSPSKPMALISFLDDSRSLPCLLGGILNIAAHSDVLKPKFHGIWHKSHVICLFKSFQRHSISLRVNRSTRNHLQGLPSPSPLQPQLLSLFPSLMVSSDTVLHAVSQIHSRSLS